MREVRLEAPAKINLGLEIVGRREDGYHLIQTFFQAISIYDVLTFTPSRSGIHLTIDGARLETGDKNLVYKAASKILNYAGIQEGVKIHLKKVIPIGAGLGGGSSDAAATLMGISQLYDLSVTKEDLWKLAISVGADVSFFLDGPSAFGYGIGEILESSPPLPPFSVVVVKPDFSISTRWAYGAFDQILTKGTNKIKILKSVINSLNREKIGEALFNDLESVCFNHHPVLEEIKQRLLCFGACGALMAGSGSAVFGLFTDPERAQEVFESIKSGEREVFLCSTILK